MHPKGSCKCKHCNDLFFADVRNRGRQKYCAKPACRKASKAASQRHWVGQSVNRDYFKGAAHCERVRQWRLRNPGYWRRSKARDESLIQDTLNPQSVAYSALTTAVGGALQDPLPVQPAAESTLGKADEAMATVPVPAPCALQDPSLALCLLLGHFQLLLGDALQEDMASMLSRLHKNGRKLLESTGGFFLPSNERQTYFAPRAPTASTAPL